MNEIEEIYKKFCRYDFKEPGYDVIDCEGLSSKELRAKMVYLKENLSKIHLKKRAQYFSYLAVGRFDQQVTTKLHRDNAAEESVLILGYEKTSVESELFIADYSRWAFINGIKPCEFLEKFNPIFTAGEELLKEMINKIGMDSSKNQIVIINNSVSVHGAMQGVLHAAKIKNPNNKSSRVVNSMTLIVTTGKGDLVEQDEIRDFQKSTFIHKKKSI